MAMSRFKISLYALIPIIFTGIAVIAVITTYQIFRFTSFFKDTDSTVQMWGIGIGAFTFFCAFLITWLVLKPIKAFINRVVDMPVFSRSPGRTPLGRQGDDIKDFKVVFEKVSDLLSKVEPREIYPEIVGQGKAIRGICETIAKIRPTDGAVLIQGEEGTGKERIARVLHKSTSGNSPFVTVDCSVLSENDLELDLFGYEKGSFTGAKSRKYGKLEAAADGTVFLDDVSRLSLNSQARLLRVLQERAFERVGGRERVRLGARVIAASRRDLAALVREGHFRDDLYYLLNVVMISVPPLRDRKEDIPQLVDYMLRKVSRELQRNVIAVSTDVMDAFMKYAWPGNVRELEDLLTRAAAVSRRETLHPDDFPGFMGAVTGRPSPEGPAPRPEKDLGTLLVKANLLKEDQLRAALSEGPGNSHRLKDRLIRSGMVSEDRMIELFCLQFKLERFEPDRHAADPALSQSFPVNLARKFRMAPLSGNGRTLRMAVTDPMDDRALDLAKFAFDRDIEPVVCTEAELDTLISAAYSAKPAAEAQEVLQDAGIAAVVSDKEITIQEKEDAQGVSRKGWAEDKMVVRLVNSIIARAIQEGASEVLFNPQVNNLQIRLRIGGKLSEITDLPKSTYLPIVARVRKLADMDMTAAHVPEEGRFSVGMEEKEYQIRFSSIPTVHGENIILRLHDAGDDLYDFSRLGMFPGDREALLSALQRPSGLLLCGGPALSGRTTTLYTLLKEIRRPDIHIMTVEDPVENYFEGMSQIQLNRRAGMTFPDGLRSVMKHSPDAIMIGDIRDPETAALAAQASLGCRVLTSLTAHDAAGAVTRLADLGIDRFLTSTVLLASVSQRLVKAVCPECRETYRPGDQVLDLWGLSEDEEVTFSYGRGCESCRQTGYRGRTGIFEVLVPDDMIREMIVKGASAREISEAAVMAGKLRTLKEDAIRKVQLGLTTLEEVTSAVMI